MGPIPHHMHQSDEHAKRVGRRGKPEAYYFPPQYNPTDNNYPYTFMGLEPGTTKDDIRRCLENWNVATTESPTSRARIAWSADRLADQSGHSPRAGLAADLRAAGEQRRVRDVPVRSRRAHHRLEPADEGRSAGAQQGSGLHHRDARLGGERESQVRRIESLLPEARAPFAQTEAEGYREQWICYGTCWYSAKELTVLPKRSVTIKDAAAYGVILTQGYGTFGALQVSTPAMIRYGQMTEDELFVTAAPRRTASASRTAANRIRS